MPIKEPNIETARRLSRVSPLASTVSQYTTKITGKPQVRIVFTWQQSVVDCVRYLTQTGSPKVVPGSFPLLTCAKPENRRAVAECQPNAVCCSMFVPPPLTNTGRKVDVFGSTIARLGLKRLLSGKALGPCLSVGIVFWLVAFVSILRCEQTAIR